MLIVPAQAADVAALRLTLPSSVYRLLLAQLVLSEAYTAFADGSGGNPLAIGGLAPLDDGAAEVWFVVRPRALSRHLLPVLRFASGVIGKAGRPVICHVYPGNVAGERMARLLGFAPQSVMLGGARQWRRE